MNISVTADSSLLSPTGSVNTIPPNTAIHEQMATQNYFTTSTTSPIQDQRCQSGQSAKKSVIPGEGDSSKNYGADQQRLQISDFHFYKFPTPATFACWKIRFKTEVCTCSQFPTEAMHWIKEVEMVDSVDDLMSSSSIEELECQIVKYSMRGLLQH